MMNWVTNALKLRMSKRWRWPTRSHLACTWSGSYSGWSDCQVGLLPLCQRRPIIIIIIITLKIMIILRDICKAFDISHEQHILTVQTSQKSNLITEKKHYSQIVVVFLESSNCHTQSSLRQNMKNIFMKTSSASLCKPKTWRPLCPSICFSTLGGCDIIH